MVEPDAGEHAGGPAGAGRGRGADASAVWATARAFAVWAVANLALGYLATFPLLFAVLLGQYLRAEAGGETPPFQAAEATASAGAVVVLGVPLVVVSVVANRWLRRRLPRWPALGFWAVTVAVQLAPFTWFMLGTDRGFPALLGRGLLW